MEGVLNGGGTYWGWGLMGGSLTGGYLNDGGVEAGGGGGAAQQQQKVGGGGGPPREQQLKGQPQPQPHTVHLWGGGGHTAPHRDPLCPIETPCAP